MGLDDAFARCLGSLHEAALDDARWPAASGPDRRGLRHQRGNALTGLAKGTGAGDRIHFARLSLARRVPAGAWRASTSTSTTRNDSGHAPPHGPSTKAGWCISPTSGPRPSAGRRRSTTRDGAAWRPCNGLNAHFPRSGRPAPRLEPRRPRRRRLGARPAPARSSGCCRMCASSSACARRWRRPRRWAPALAGLPGQRPHRRGAARPRRARCWRPTRRRCSSCASGDPLVDRDGILDASAAGGPQPPAEAPGPRVAGLAGRVPRAAAR